MELTVLVNQSSLFKEVLTEVFDVLYRYSYEKLLDKAVAKSYTPELTEGRPVYHLRGGIDFDKILAAAKAEFAMIEGSFSGHNLHVGKRPCC